MNRDDFDTISQMLHARTVARSARMGSGDKRPPIKRPGSERAAQLPSRVGNRLYWPDGRVEDAR